MNNRAKDLRMLKTRFANPHGLDHINNYSCCEDIYLMCREAMQKEIFRKIVHLPTHKGTFKFFKEGKVVCKPVFWANTNKLLEKSDVTGIKTGVTAKAGGCLATSFTIDPRNEGFVIVLGSTSTESRFRDTLKIISWASEEVSND
jgi:D-alanyl-D-alanine carboxypeptidase